MLSPSLSEYASTVDRLAPILLDTAARSVVVLGLAGLTALMMHRASAAARHWVWLLGFAGLLLLPVLSATLPGWRVLPRMEMNRTAPVAIIHGAGQSLPAAPVEQPTSSFRTESPASARPEMTIAPAAAPLQATAPSKSNEPISASQIDTSAQIAALPWTFWLALIWMMGSLLVIGHVLLGYLSLWWLQRRCTKIDDGHWADLLAQLQEELQIHREVELLSSPVRTMPMTWGLWRTRLLLPKEACNWEPEQRRAVLLHELGHVRRCDCLTQLLGRFVCAAYWFNPAVWFAWNRMQVERERACDDLVLSTGAKASAYAQHLLHSAAAMPALRFIGAAALAMARPSTLEERLRAILDGRRNRRALTLRNALATMLLLVAALVPVAALRAQDTPAPAPTPAGGPSIAPATRPSTTAPATRPTSFDGGRAGPRGRGGRIGGGDARGPQAPLSLGEGPTCALDVTIYDLRLPVDKIGLLDVNALTRASATVAEYEKALAELGSAKPLYRVNQSVRLAGDSITVGSETPFVTFSANRGGQGFNTVQYRSTGAIFKVAGKAEATGRIELDMNIQATSLSDSNTLISADVKAPMFRNTIMSHKGTVEANRPFVVVSVDAASVDPDGKAVAHIARVTLGAPQSTSAPARGG